MIDQSVIWNRDVLQAQIDDIGMAIRTGCDGWLSDWWKLLADIETHHKADPGYQFSSAELYKGTTSAAEIFEVCQWNDKSEGE